MMLCSRDTCSSRVLSLLGLRSQGRSSRVWYASPSCGHEACREQERDSGTEEGVVNLQQEGIFLLIVSTGREVGIKMTQMTAFRWAVGEQGCFLLSLSGSHGEINTVQIPSTCIDHLAPLCCQPGFLKGKATTRTLSR